MSYKDMLLKDKNSFMVIADWPLFVEIIGYIDEKCVMVIEGSGECDFSVELSNKKKNMKVMGFKSMVDKNFTQVMDSTMLVMKVESEEDFNYAIKCNDMGMQVIAYVSAELFDKLDIGIFDVGFTYLGKNTDTFDFRLA